MDLFYFIWSMMILSFLIQFFLMSFIMTNSSTNITFSVGKFYMSCIMALIMGLLEIGMHDYNMYNRFFVSSSYYLSLTFSLVVFIYLYRNQIYINDNDYLSEMIEHHSMALLTSEQILEKTQSEKIRKLATNIVDTQQAEINYMKQLLMN
jgi:hypothetical protein